jgi:hypothetical protein
MMSDYNHAGDFLLLAGDLSAVCAQRRQGRLRSDNKMTSFWYPNHNIMAVFAI